MRRQRDRFEFAAERDSDRVQLSPLVEFHPHAAVSGRVQFGVERRSFRQRDEPEDQGTFLRVNLGYTLLGRTRFSVSAVRELAYSYRLTAEEYQLAGMTVAVTQHLGRGWDARASVGRHRLTYLDTAGDAPSTPADGNADAEAVTSWGVGLGYRLARTRVGVDVSYRARAADASLRREFQRLRVGSSVTYVFD